MRLGLVYPKGEEAQPLGMASIATYLREYMDFDKTRIIDLRFENLTEAIRSWRPDVIGFSSMTFSYGDVIRTAKDLKQTVDTPLLLGGVHVSTLPTSLHEVFDLGVVGEGEQTMLELMQLYEREGGFPKQRLRDIKGLVFRENDSIVFTGNRPLIMPLDRIPIPDRKFMNKRYFNKRLIFWGEESYSRVGALMTSRGCPYKCAFCSTSKFWQNFRMFSTKRIFDEIKMLVEDFKVDHIDILDDLFVCNKQRLREIRDLLIKDGLMDKVIMNCTARVNFIDDELCGILKELNVRSLNFGFESGSNRILRLIKKEGVTVELIKNATKICRRHNIHVSAGIILGHPTETLEEMEKTINLIRWLADECVDVVWIYIMTPYPGTDIWEMAKQMGRVSDNINWEVTGSRFSNNSNNTLLLDDINNPLLLDESVSIADFKRMWRMAYEELDRMRKPRRRLHRLMMRLRYMPVRTLREGARNPKESILYIQKALSSVISRS